MKNRFYVSSEKLHEVSAELIDKGFEELDPCVNEDDLSSKLFIDTLKKTFYATDDDCLEQTNLILVEKHQTSYKSTTIKKIKAWQN